MAVVLAGLQLVDVAGNELVPPRLVAAHLDHLGVPPMLRPALPLVKLAGSAGLLAGLRWPRLGAASAAGLIGFYAGAIAFHLRAGDRWPVALPAAVLGAAAASALITVYAPAASGAAAGGPR